MQFFIKPNYGNPKLSVRKDIPPKIHYTGTSIYSFAKNKVSLEPVNSKHHLLKPQFGIKSIK